MTVSDKTDRALLGTLTLKALALNGDLKSVHLITWKMGWVTIVYIAGQEEGLLCDANVFCGI